MCTKYKNMDFLIQTVGFIRKVLYNNYRHLRIALTTIYEVILMVTLKDIAARAGVSMMTVSRVMNGNQGGKASEATAVKIRSIAEEMGYVPNSSARSLAARSSKIIAVVLRDSTDGNPLADPYSSMFLGIIIQTMQRRGYYVMVHFVQDYSDITFWLRSWRAEGAIFLGVFDNEIRNIRNSNRIPLVFTDSYSNVRQVSNVGIDDYKGGVLAAQHFLSRGHTRLAFAGPPSETTGVIAERLAGFSEALAQAGVPLPENWIYNTSRQSPAEILADITSCDEHPTGLFVTSDLIASQFYEAALQTGVEIPDQLSLIGFDDFPLDRILTPTLTSVHQDVSEKALRACDILLRRIADPNAPSESLMLDVHLVERDSVRDI